MIFFLCCRPRKSFKDQVRLLLPQDCFIAVIKHTSRSKEEHYSKLCLVIQSIYYSIYYAKHVHFHSLAKDGPSSVIKSDFFSQFLKGQRLLCPDFGRCLIYCVNKTVDKSPESIPSTPNTLLWLYIFNRTVCTNHISSVTALT